MIACIQHIRVVNTVCIYHFHLVHSFGLLYNLISLLFVTEKEFYLVLLMLLELGQFLLLRHHENFFEDLFILLLTLAWERLSALLSLLLMCVAHCFCHSIRLFCLFL